VGSEVEFYDLRREAKAVDNIPELALGKMIGVRWRRE
jgi:hypothetical protein